MKEVVGGMDFGLADLHIAGTLKTSCLLSLRIN